MIRLKTKLTLGVGTLFVLIVILALISSLKIRQLTSDTSNILVANYNSLDYTRNMLMTLDQIYTSEAMLIFEQNLQKQLGNITEVGEKEVTENLKSHFLELKNDYQNAGLQLIMRKELYQIMKLNMDAIERKSKMAEQTASSATFWIMLTGCLCFLIAFTLLMNLPGAIANPIREMTDSIKQIAVKNYHHRVHFEGSKEFKELGLSFNAMASKLEEYEHSTLAKLIIEKKRIETLINNLKNPVVGLDENKMIIYINEVALKICNLKSEQVIGRSALDVALTNDLIRTLIREIVYLDSESDSTLKIFYNGKESYFEKEIIGISIQLTGEKETITLGHFILLNDITIFKELDYAKTNFIATISHELKTPIASLKMSAQLLSDKRIGELNQEQGKLLQHISEDTDRLLKITGELLNLTQVESGKIQLCLQQTTVDALLKYALDATLIAVEQKKITVTQKLPPQTVFVKADPEKTAWVLINLITNAVRYSSEFGEILIDVKEEKDNVLFRVKDNGQGIDLKYQDKIFERYFQVPGSNKSGTGLGLSISKEFIEAQGGEIRVESKPGDGAVFSFSLTRV